MPPGHTAPSPPAPARLERWESVSQRTRQTQLSGRLGAPGRMASSVRNAPLPERVGMDPTLHRIMVTRTLPSTSEPPAPGARLLMHNHVLRTITPISFIHHLKHELISCFHRIPGHPLRRVRHWSMSQLSGAILSTLGVHVRGMLHTWILPNQIQVPQRTQFQSLLLPKAVSNLCMRPAVADRRRTGPSSWLPPL